MATLSIRRFRRFATGGRYVISPPSGPEYATLPQITGTPQVDEIVTAIEPDVINGTQITGGPEWVYSTGGAAVGVAVGLDYDIPEADEDKLLVVRFEITGTNGDAIWVESAPFGPIQAAPVGEQQPGALLTSATVLGVPVTFDRPVYAGRYADGDIMWVLKDREFYLMESLPASVAIPASKAFTDYASTAHALGEEIWANGAMINPCLPFFANPGWNDASQGFEQLLAYPISNGDDAPMIYAHAKNVDPGASGPLHVTPEMEPFSYVKSVRLTGMTTPSEGFSWRTFQRFSVIHFVDVVPPKNAIAPSASSIDKTSHFTADMLSADVFNVPGFRLPSGLNTVEQSNAAQVVNSVFQPFFGQFGEYQRLFMINPALGSNSGYSRDYAKLWANHLFACYAMGSSLPLSERIKIATIGEQLRGLGEVMVWGRNPGTSGTGNVGAGQMAGYIMWLFLLGMMTWRYRPGIFNEVFAMLSNELEQTGQVNDQLVGFSVTSSDTGSFAHTTLRLEDLGRYMWTHTPRTPAEPMRPHSRMNATFPGNYETESSGQAVQPCVYVMAMAQDGPGGATGAQVIAGGATLAAGTRKPHVIGYADDYVTRVATRTDPYGVASGTILQQVYRDIYAATRANWGVPRWMFTPGNVTPTWQNQPSFLWPVTNGFGYNFTGMGSEPADDPATSCNIYYSLDEKGWVTLANQPLTGTVTGLPAGKGIFVQIERINSRGAGPRTVNHKRLSTDSFAGNPNGYRMWITTLGTAAGTPTNTAQPKLVRNRYPEWWHFDVREVPSPLDLANGDTIELPDGMWSGAFPSGFTRKWFRNGSTEITGETGRVYQIRAADRGGTIEGELTPVDGGSPVRTPAIIIPGRAAQATDIIFEHDFSGGLRSEYPGVYASLFADSVNGTLIHRYLGKIFDANGNLLTTGTMRLNKSSSHPSLIANLAADYPVIVDHLYEVIVDLVFESYRTDADRQTRVLLTAAKHTLTNATPSGYLGGPSGTGAGYSGDLSSNPKPRVQRYSFTVQAKSAALWYRQWVSTGDGGVVGGNPELSYARVRHLGAA